MNNAIVIDPAAVDLPPTQSIEITALGPLNGITGAANVSKERG
jgi:hypothetical protein